MIILINGRLPKRGEFRHKMIYQFVYKILINLGLRKMFLIYNIRLLLHKVIMISSLFLMDNLKHIGNPSLIKKKSHYRSILIKQHLNRSILNGRISQKISKYSLKWLILGILWIIKKTTMRNHTLSN